MKSNVLLFEDDSSELKIIKESLERELGDSGIQIISFDSIKRTKRNGTYEERLLADLVDYLPHTELIICDQDLSGTHDYVGLSANTISAFATELGIPLAMYGRGSDEQSMAVRLKKRRPFLDGHFVLQLSDAEWDARSFAISVKKVLLGCREVVGFVRETYKDKPKWLKKATPASWLSNLLKEPSITTRLSLYGFTQQGSVAAVLGGDEAELASTQMRFFSTELSYALWSSVIRFPGILLNNIAASSFCDFSPESWKNQKLQEHFKSARYHGPFSDISPNSPDDESEQYWWRDKLEEILDGEKGLDFSNKMGIKNLERSQCCENSDLSGGYYCMIKKQPVSLENSRGNIPYFPKGADISRISLSEYNKYAPWIGLEVSE